MSRRLAAMLAACAVLTLVLAVLSAQPPARAQTDPCAPAAARASGPAALETPDALVLAPGQTASADAVLRLERRPTPVDVFFLVDSSGSMQPVIDSLKQSIREAARGLSRGDIDVQVGLGDFSDLGARPYRRLLALEPVDCDIVDALESIETGGGEESHRLALEQVVTGSGRPEVGVPPGLVAGFRPGTLRLVMHATDERIDDSLPFSPTHDELTAAYRAASVRHVGIHVVDASAGGTDANSDDPLGELRRDLDALGRDTGALAPPGGIDCEDDGSVDLAPGQPVTCPFTATGSVPSGGAVPQTSMGDLVVEIVEALRSTTDVELAVQDAGGIDVRVDRPAVAIDLSNPSPVRYGMTFACPPEMAGSEAAVRFAGRVAGEVVASATSRVSCLASAPAAVTPARLTPPPAATPQIAPTPAAAPAPVAAPAPASAPASAAAGASSPATASATAPAPAPSPMFGIALAPEAQEVQLARSTVDHGETTRAAGAVMSVAAAAALARRRARATARSRVR